MGMTSNWCAATLTALVALVAIPETLDVRHNYPPPQTITQLSTDPDKLALSRAFSSTFAFKPLGAFKGGASCVIVGKTPLPDGKYKYVGLTCWHVVDDIVEALEKDPEFDMTYVFTGLGWNYRSEFEAEVTIEWQLPTRDWATFTFISEHDIPGVELASKEEFTALGPLDKVYLISNADSQGLVIDEATIGSTHNRWPSYATNPTTWPWADHPNDYFRVMTFIWYGSSGGAVFNAQGKLIGIINATAIFGGHHNDPTGHPAIILKSYVILERVLEVNPEYFVIESRK